MAGFFGLEWTNNATLEVIIEKPFFNNTLAGAYQCNNSYSAVARGGSNASRIWEDIYLREATARLNKLSGNYNWTLSDSYNASVFAQQSRSQSLLTVT
jgi:Histidine phosphatase superfamily (branch 2)